MKVLNSEKSRILQTKDYAIFNYSTYRIRQNTVSELMADIRKKNLNKDLPIMVDDEFNILKGRHAFIALMKLGLPIHYKVCEVAEQLDFLIAKKYSKKATPFDFCVHHKDKLYYRQLIDFLGKTHLTFMVVYKEMLRLSTNRGSTLWKEFQEGDFEISEDTKLEMERFLKISAVFESHELRSTDYDEYFMLIDVSIKVLNALFIEYKEEIDCFKSIYGNDTIDTCFVYGLYQLHFHKRITKSTTIDFNLHVVRVLRELGKYDVLIDSLESIDIVELNKVCDDINHSYRRMTDYEIEAKRSLVLYHQIHKEKELLDKK